MLLTTTRTQGVVRVLRDSGLARPCEQEGINSLRRNEEEKQTEVCTPNLEIRERNKEEAD